MSAVAAAPSMSPRGLALLRTFRAAFEALAEHGKAYPHEQTQIAESCAAHLRSAWPMAAVGAPAQGVELQVDPITLCRFIERDLHDGAKYRLEVREADDVITFRLDDSFFDNAAVALTTDQAATLRDDLGRALAARGQ